ncbi:MAG: 50S ribosomal protein L11 methyltransferase [Alphaproteobacteria bacterium]
MTLKLSFSVPQFAAEKLAAGLDVIEDLVFDRSADSSGGLGLKRSDPTFPIRCNLYVDNTSAAQYAVALISVISDLAAFEMPKVTEEPVEPQDWVKITQDNLPPVEVGRFYIRGGHSTAPTDEKVDLLIEAGLAFGTGHHETTRGCLSFYDKMLSMGLAPVKVLDMGCGSGVLAMAAAKTSKAQVVGIELDQDSLKVAQDNLLVNNLCGRVEYILGATPDLGFENYDLIFANILADPLIKLAPQLTHVANSKSNLLLAGLLVEQEVDVLNAYVKLGWKRLEGYHDGQWSIQWLTKHF